MKKFLTMLLAAAILFALAACGTTTDEKDNNNNTQDGHQSETPDTSYEAPKLQNCITRTLTTPMASETVATTPTAYLRLSPTRRAQRLSTRLSPMSTALSWTAYWKPLQTRSACPAST